METLIIWFYFLTALQMMLHGFSSDGHFASFELKLLAFYIEGLMLQISTMQTAISALQSALQEDFKATEIEV